MNNIKKNNIENNILNIIELLDNKIATKHSEFREEVKRKGDLEKELNNYKLKLRKMELLKMALLNENKVKNIIKYNANYKNTLKQNYNLIKSKYKNINEINNEIKEYENKINEIELQLNNKNKIILELSSKIGSIIDLVNRLSSKVQTYTNNQKKLINDIYKRTQIKSILNKLNEYYEAKQIPKPNRNQSIILKNI